MTVPQKTCTPISQKERKRRGKGRKEGRIQPKRVQITGNKEKQKLETDFIRHLAGVGVGIHQREQETSKARVGKQEDTRCDSSRILWKIRLPETEITQHANST